MNERAAGRQEAPAAGIGFAASLEVERPPRLFSLPPDLHAGRAINAASFDHTLLAEAMRDPDDHGDW